MPRFPHILAVGLNPAWQKTLFFERFAYGRVNRAETMEELAAGKGINVARAAQADGAQATVVQFAGGEAGRKILAALADEGIAELTVATRAATRTCTTILDAAERSMTELIEPSQAVTEAEIAALRGHIADAIPACHGVAICGTFPPGVPEDFYADIIASLRGRRPVVLDAYRGVGLALAQGPDVVKINADELASLTGCGSDVPQGIEALLRRSPATMVAVTAGPSAAYLGTRCGLRRFSLPAVGDVVSPLGAGDTVTARFLVRLCQSVGQGILPFPFTGLDESATDHLAELFADGLAAASASCRTSRPATFRQPDAAEIRKAIVVSRLTG